MKEAIENLVLIEKWNTPQSLALLSGKILSCANKSASKGELELFKHYF
jgi:hypothetical protein